MDSSLDVSVIGQLLLMQSVLTSLPDEKSILDFACRGLKDVPGVRSATICSREKAASIDQADCFPVKAASSASGNFCFKVADRETFAPYEPYIKNFCVIISVIIEEQKQRKIKESYSQELESQVRRRTSQLEEEIAKHKNTADALEENASKFSAIFDQSSEGIFLHDYDGRIIDVNRMGCIQTGYTRNELLSMSVFDLHEKNEDAATRKETILKEWKSWTINQKHSIEAEHARKDGTVFPINLSTSVIQYGGRNLILAIVQDITEKKISEIEKEKLQQQLFQSQKMEAIGVLAGGVAHDFNNILGIILGSAQLARYEVSNNSEAANELSLIVDSAKRARELTTKLLTFARKEKPEKSVNSVKKIIEHASALLERTLPKNISIRNVIEEEVKILCEQNQLHQVIMNLCTNAADAMPSGGDITIECEEVNFPEGICDACGKELVGKYCLIQVSDDGVGIPEDILPKVTDPFFTTKGVGKGTGLGMSVSLGIVNNHDGHMHIYSELGKGTCVKIYLPMAGTEEIQEEVVEVKKDVSGNETVLIIDDEKPLLEMAGRFLRKKGYDVILASGGIQGIELFEENRDKISAVVLDLMMPEIDGPETFSELRRIKPDVKVIFASGYSINGQAHQMLEEGNYRFVQKPFDVEELCASIREVIDSAK